MTRERTDQNGRGATLRRIARVVFALQAALALLMVLGVLLVAGSAGRAIAADPPEPKLLLLPIVVHSAEDPVYLRDGLSDMLAARFSRIGGLRVERKDGDGAGTTRPEEALAAGRKVGADYVLFGSFTRFGKGASLDVQCAPVGAGKTRAPLREIFVHSGSIGEIIPDLDELAGKVSRFARGEDVTAGAPAVGAEVPGAVPAAGGAQYDELLSRVEALEAAFTELLESDSLSFEEELGEAGTAEEVR